MSQEIDDVRRGLHDRRIQQRAHRAACDLLEHGLFGKIGRPLTGEQTVMLRDATKLLIAHYQPIELELLEEVERMRMHWRRTEEELTEQRRKTSLARWLFVLANAVWLGVVLL